MKTRIMDVPGVGFSFLYAEGKRPQAHDWHFVGGAADPAAWATTRQRDSARACFTNRRSVQAALADLQRKRLLRGGNK